MASSVPLVSGSAASASMNAPGGMPRLTGAAIGPMADLGPDTLVLRHPLAEVLPELLAGSLPLADSGDPLASVALVVRDLLGTDSLHLVVTADRAARRVHYFAVRSASLHSTTSLALPLTAALPGHPAHQGDGVYLLHTGELTAAAIYQGSQLRLIVNEPALMDAVVMDTGLPAYDVGSLTNGWPLLSRKGQLQQVTDRASLLAVRWGGAVAVLAGVAYLAMSGLASWYGAQVPVAREDQQATMLRKVLDEVQFATPLSETVARLQTVAATVVRAGGWIDTYQVERGSEHFRIHLPEWVTRDYLTTLGSTARADLNGDGTVLVVKGLPGPAGKPERRTGAAAAGATSASDAAAAPAGAGAAGNAATPATPGGAAAPTAEPRS